MQSKSIQETYAPNNACFGCGPANPKGLHVRSFPDWDAIVAEWQPSHKPPCTVTADYSIRLLRPTPTEKPVKLVARTVESTEERAVVEGELIADGKVCATCRGTFVAVKPGHPAYHRW